LAGLAGLGDLIKWIGMAKMDEHFEVAAPNLDAKMASDDQTTNASKHWPGQGILFPL